MAESGDNRLENLGKLAELTRRRQWVVWRLEPNPDKPKPDKVLYNPKTGRHASSTDPATWATFAEAAAEYRRGEWAGVGFVCTEESRVVFIDLDHVRDPEAGEILPEALALVRDFATYAEISQSGRGLHVLALGEVPGERCKAAGYFGPGTELEMYKARRFVALTGDVLPGAPLAVNERAEQVAALYARAFPAPQPEPERRPRPAPALTLDDSQVLERARKFDRSGKFARLWAGEIGEYDGDDSRADQALCCKLAYWTSDPEQIDRLFRQSGLYRGKWERPDYRERTIGRALDLVEPAAATIAGGQERNLPAKIGARVPHDLAQDIADSAAPCPAPQVRKAVHDALLTPKTPAMDRRREAGRIMLTWLQGNGGFVQGEDQALYYFSEAQRRLLNMATESWAAWLYGLTGCNPASTDFAYLLADCKAVALASPRRPVLKVAAWDSDAQVLRVSHFDGTVYVLDGENITTEANGQNVLFDDDPRWPAYAPDFSHPGALRWLSEEIPSWPAGNTTAPLAFRAWAVSTFFSELCPSRPLTVFLGEKGSGKSTALRLFLRFMFGPAAELSGVPDRPDGFTAAAAAHHLLFLDNLDQFTGWLRDKLARIATGADDSYRKLYTSNEAGRVLYRCWLAFTARTPDTLRRDDLADRLLILPVERIGDERRRKETDLMAQAEALRGAWWGDVLTTCNAVVARIRRGELAGVSRLRLADWEALGRLVARAEGQEPAWDTLCQNLQREQGAFLLEDDPIAEALRRWVSEGRHQGAGPLTARQLYGELTATMYGDQKPDSDWPKTARAFGKRLAMIRRELQGAFDLGWEKSSELANRGALVYSIRGFDFQRGVFQHFSCSNIEPTETFRKEPENSVSKVESSNLPAPLADCATCGAPTLRRNTSGQPVCSRCAGAAAEAGRLPMAAGAEV